MKRIAIALLIAAPAAALAASPPNVKDQCSTKVAETKKKSELLAQAKVPAAEAQAIAMDASKGNKVAKGGIQRLDGCLVYSFHVRNDAEKTQTEVLVDAGSGKVLHQAKGPAPDKAIERPVDNTKEIDAVARAKISADRAKAAPVPPGAPPKK